MKHEKNHRIAFGCTYATFFVRLRHRLGIGNKQLPGKKRKTTIGEAEKNQKIRQAVVNKCCSYSNCDSIKGLEIGTQKLVDETDDEWIYEVSGTYYPVDKYGDLGDNYKFDITLEVTKQSGYTYASTSYIRRNY